MGSPDPASTSGGDFDDFLEHYGIKGMRWGIRRKNPSGGTTSVAPASDDVERARRTYATVRTHGTKAVSNKDLQDLINRLNLEAQYTQVIAKNTHREPTVLEKINAGNKKVRVILDAGKTVYEIDQLLKKGTGSGLGDIAKKVKTR